MAKVPKRTDLSCYVGRFGARFHFCGCSPIRVRRVVFGSRVLDDARMSVRMTAASQQAWARVRILLNLGRVPEATTEAVAASAGTNWDRFRLKIAWGAGMIHGTDEMAIGWCWLEPGSYRLLIAESVLEEFSLSNALAEFADVIETMDEPAFRSYDPANWRRLDQLGF